jgi:uncharacterized C2H2 Zn-finger protein
LTVQCPECGYTFSDKEDFKLYEVGEIIQCPVCETELKVNKDQQLEVLDLEESEHED